MDFEGAEPLQASATAAVDPVLRLRDQADAIEAAARLRQRQLRAVEFRTVDDRRALRAAERARARADRAARAAAATTSSSSSRRCRASTRRAAGAVAEARRVAPGADRRRGRHLRAVHGRRRAHARYDLWVPPTRSAAKATSAPRGRSTSCERAWAPRPGRRANCRSSSGWPGSTRSRRKSVAEAVVKRRPVGQCASDGRATSTDARRNSASVAPRPQTAAIVSQMPGAALSASHVDQPGRDQRRQPAEQRGREAVREREADHAHLHRHDLGQRDHHRAVVEAVQRRQHQLDLEHPREARRRREPDHHRIGRQDRQRPWSRPGSACGRCDPTARRRSAAR